MLPPRVRRETGHEFVARVLKEQREGNGVAFAIRRRGSSDVMGQIRLMNWSPSERRAEVGYWIGRSYWGHGYATEAVQLVCGFGFRRMRLHRIDATVIESNSGSTRVLEKAGFRAEGILRDAARLDRGWADEVVYGLLRSEWDRERSSKSSRAPPVDRPSSETALPAGRGQSIRVHRRE